MNPVMMTPTVLNYNIKPLEQPRKWLIDWLKEITGHAQGLMGQTASVSLCIDNWTYFFCKLFLHVI